MTGEKRLWWGSSSFGVVRPEAKGELVVVLPLYDDSPVKDGWFSPLSRLVCEMGHRLTSRDMVDIADTFIAQELTNYITPWFTPRPSGWRPPWSCIGPSRTQRVHPRPHRFLRETDRYAIPQRTGSPISVPMLLRGVPPTTAKSGSRA
jgi:hypothetical protein